MNTELNASHSAVEDRKNALVKDIKSVVGDADALLKEVAGATAEEFTAARTKIETRLSDMKGRLHDARIETARKACAAADATQAYIRDNPWKVLGVAAAAGVVIRWVLRRR